MKLRIHRDSLRLRVSRSELAQFAESGVLEERFYFGRESGTELTYALVRDAARRTVDVDSSPNRVAVLIPATEADEWSTTDQVGISGVVDLGDRGSLAILVEKDFACLDRGAEENTDTFPNPHAAHKC